MCRRHGDVISPWRPRLRSSPAVHREAGRGHGGVAHRPDPHHGERDPRPPVGLSILAVVLLLSASVLILNTIRMAIFARRREVSVMKLVGATNWFIRLPFMAEGLVQGLLGGGVAVLAVLGLYWGSGWTCPTTPAVLSPPRWLWAAGRWPPPAPGHGGRCGGRRDRLGLRRSPLPRRLIPHPALGARSSVYHRWGRGSPRPSCSLAGHGRCRRGDWHPQPNRGPIDHADLGR